jgi:hypothetical protein
MNQYYNTTEQTTMTPAATSLTAGPTVSAKYTFVPTRELVWRLIEVGFKVARAEQARVINPDRQGFQKHLVALRHSDASWDARAKVSGFMPEIIMTNAHDGSSSFTLQIGIFRVICLNKLVVGAGIISAIKFPHRGSKSDLVVNAAMTLVDKIPTVLGKVGEMQKRVLDFKEVGSFAEQALAIRYPENPPVSPVGLVQIRRDEDREPTLWNVFNRIQENLLNGGMNTATGIKSPRNRMRYVRPCRGIDSSVKINCGLFDLAASYLN